MGANSRAELKWRRACRAGMTALCLAGVTLSPAGAVAQVRLPTMGDVASEELPVGVERRYGDEIMREVWRDPAYLDDPVLQDYLVSLWQPMLATARQRGDIDDDLWAQFAWKTFLVNDRSVNAFALPGGYVGVHLGLIAVTASRDELASVLAHELSHVSQRHIARSVASANRQGTASLAAMLLGILVAARSGSADVAQAAIAGSQAAAIQGQLNFSRDMEREADRVGFGIFRDAGFGPAGMAAMFEKLDQAGRLNDSGAFPYLRSHPLTVERISEARMRLSADDLRTGPADMLHAMMQARARVLMDLNEAALRRHLDAIRGADANQASPGLLYAATLAAVHLREFGAAERSITRLRIAIADRGTGLVAQLNELTQLLEAETLMAQGQFRRAAASLMDGTPTVSKSRASLLLRASAILQLAPSWLADAVRIDEELREWLAVHRDDSAVWELHGQTSAFIGHRLQALRAQAEARAAQGDFAAAIDRLRAAQRASRGATGAELVDASIIDARLRELELRQRSIVKPGVRAGSPAPG